MPLVTNDKEKKDKNEWLRQGTMMFAESTGWIAFPVVGALFLGQWLDEKQGTEPLYFFGLTALAFIVSTIGIGITGVKYMKRIESEEALIKKAEGLETSTSSAESRSREEDSKSKKLENNDDKHRS